MRADALEDAWRQERAAVLATVARRIGDLGIAEDAVQEAFAAAAIHWPRTGVPDRPGAWLTTTAWRKAIGMLRRIRPTTPVDAFADVAGPDGGFERAEAADVVDDDLLGLVLACAHPALAPELRVALTLRHVTGLTTQEIAAAFVVSEAAMAKRLVRARAKLRDAGISFELPPRHALAERISDAHAVIYLVFTEGYLASGEGEPVRAELCADAIWLARQLHRLVPDDDETVGLLALLLVQHSRRAARRDAGGRLLPFDEQERAQWDLAALDEARRLLARTGSTPPGAYQLQAAIALLHAAAPSVGQIDWPRIVGLYDILLRLEPTPVVELNRAVAVGYADGPRAGLTALAPVAAGGRLQHYAPFHAARAELLERTGDGAAAREAWRRAASLVENVARRNELLGRAGRAG